MSDIKKIGMYSTDEILEFMEEGEERSMFEAMYFKIQELENINEKLSLALESAENKLQQKENIIKRVREYIEKETKELYSKDKSCKYLGEIMQLEFILEILVKGE